MSDLIFCLMGPTGSGKTEIACQWVQHLPFEIISVDSAMIYQDMNIGTAKPNQDVLNAAPHHLIDICAPTARYSAAEFCQDVLRERQSIIARGKIPLLVGGTMMYFRALQQGLSILPKADESLRAELVSLHQLHGAEYMHAWLKAVDSASANRIHAQDTQRTQRALEVYLLTQRPLSELHAEEIQAPRCEFVNICLFPNRRAWLHERIAQRFYAMCDSGFLDEVSYLINHWHVSRETPSMKSVGYRQALDYLEGIIDYTTFCDNAVVATRQLAKRQLTWLRSWPNMQYFDPEESGAIKHMLDCVNQVISTPPGLSHA